MISTLTGTVLHIGLTSAVLDVRGLGYAVGLTAPHAASLTIGEEIFVHTTLIVRQEALTLYGFAGEDERTIFDHLITVTGVGPRHAIAVLSTLDVGLLAAAIHNDNDAPFRAVPGVGPKTARMIVMTPKNKIRGLVPEGAAAPPEQIAINTPARAEAGAALLSLGWKQRAVNEALEGIFSEAPADAATMSTPMLVRAALSRLG